MSSIEVSVSQDNDSPWNVSARAVEIAYYLRGLGLKDNVDFTWRFDQDTRSVKVTFAAHQEEYASLLAIKFAKG